MPTGWTFEHKKNAYPVKKRGHLSIHLVPYSEHSSYSELVEYVKFLKPHEVRWLVCELASLRSLPPNI